MPTQPPPLMHNAHVIHTAECALRTIEHIESVPHAQGLAMYAIQDIYNRATLSLQRCKSAIRTDYTLSRLMENKPEYAR